MTIHMLDGVKKMAKEDEKKTTTTRCIRKNKNLFYMADFLRHLD